jgi:hypothetical protein
MATILMDENIAGYADYLSQFIGSPGWKEISSALAIRVVHFDQVGLAKGTPDTDVWEFCQRHHYYLITDNRNQNEPESLETVIRTRSLPTSLPVFTISDIGRFRTDREYAEAVAAKMLEYVFDADNILGAGRLYLP